MALPARSRVSACKDHRLHFLETGNRLLAWSGDVRNGITHLYLGGILVVIYQIDGEIALGGTLVSQIEIISALEVFTFVR